MHDLPSSGRKLLLCEQIPAVREAIDATSNENQSTSIRKVIRYTGVLSNYEKMYWFMSLQATNVTRTEGERPYLQVGFLFIVA